MRPNELSIMLKQWAQANARHYGLVFEGVDVALLGVADSQMMTESGERGGVFPVFVATLTVRLPAPSFELYMRGDMSLNAARRLADQFESLYFQLCHDIWMTKDIAVSGRVLFAS